jgi:hypothetical protein
MVLRLEGTVNQAVLERGVVGLEGWRMGRVCEAVVWKDRWVSEVGFRRR